MDNIILLIFFAIFNLILWKNLSLITRFFKIYDIPNKKLKLHDARVSLISGIYILTNIYLYFIISKLNYSNLNNIIFENYIIISFITAIFIVGYIDDKKGINPFLRLVFFSIILLFFLLSNENYIIKEINFISYNFKLNLNFNLLFSIICFLIYLNALNFFDGINLQVGLHCLFILFILFIKSNLNLEIFILIIFYLYFLFYNWKNLVFLGNSGAYASATIISLYLINFSQQNIITATEIFVLMSIPGLDMLRLIIVRICKKKNPFKGDLNHLHHLTKKNIGIFRTSVVIISSQILNYLIYFIFLNDYLSFFSSFLIYIALYIFSISKKNG